MFELHIADKDITSGTIPVSWCLDKELLAYLAEEGNEDPTVVLIVAPVQGYHPSKEVRKVIPMKDLMTYIDFRCPGENRIFGFISTFSKARTNSFVRKQNGEWVTTVLTPEGNVCYYDGSVLTVNVPSECFAKEPSAFEKRWVNFFFRDKAVDQCSFRKRRLLAYTVQPIIFSMLMVLNLFPILAALLIADRGLFQIIARAAQPLTYNFINVLEGFGGSILWRWNNSK